MSPDNGPAHFVEQEGKQDPAAQRGQCSITHVSAASHADVVATREDTDDNARDDDEEQSQLSSDEEDDSESEDEGVSGPAISDRAIGVQVKRARQLNKSKRARVFHACEPCREFEP